MHESISILYIRWPADECLGLAEMPGCQSRPRPARLCYTFCMNFSVRKALRDDERQALSAHSALLAPLLFQRGLTDEDAAERFLSPDYDSGSHDPFLLKDSEKAAERLIKAIEGGEQVAIYADYRSEEHTSELQSH